MNAIDWTLRVLGVTFIGFVAGYWLGPQSSYVILGLGGLGGLLLFLSDRSKIKRQRRYIDKSVRRHLGEIHD